MKKSKKPIDLIRKISETHGLAECNKRVLAFSVLVQLLRNKDIDSVSKMNKILGAGIGGKISNSQIDCLSSEDLVTYTAKVIFLSYSGKLL